MAISIRTTRRIATAARLVLSSASIGALGCNAILGIDEGHLVSGDASAGGSPTGSGGSIAETGGVGGSGGATTGGSGGAPSGGGGAGGSGTGGKAAGGAAGAGGGGGGAGGIPAGVANEVHCGTASCKLSQGQVCCVAIANGDAHCSTACDPTTQAKFSCDGAEDCPNMGGKCCYPTGQTTATCAASCQGRVFCNADADCGPGQFCTPGTGPLATVSFCTNAPPAHTVWCAGASCDLSSGKVCCYSKTTMTESCTTTCGANDVRFECDGANDCASGSVCCPTLTGLGLFTGSQCVAGGCPMTIPEIQCGGANGCMSGETCCAQSTGSACAATCSTGTLCGTDADCAAAAMQCSVVTATAIGQPTGSSHCASPP